MSAPAHPAIAAVAGHLPAGPDREFSLGLELILDGLTQLLDKA
ncbi:hypothetical protein [Mycolicibacterium mucogenicum]|nr:hypothetical protein [Mycolicibacterium mucogenicum]